MQGSGCLSHKQSVAKVLQKNYSPGTWLRLVTTDQDVVARLAGKLVAPSLVETE